MKLFKYRQPEEQAEQSLFSRRDLVRLIIPIIIETFLSMTVGFVGTIMVAEAGQEAVSAVSLVDNINALILVFTTAIATGGAIIIAQYLGRGLVLDARTAAKQLLYTTIFISLILAAAVVIWNGPLLRLVFGQIDQTVMDYSRTYFVLTAISYPFLAAQNSAAAAFRSMGNSRIPMLVTLMMSVINVIVCMILIFGFSMGITGAGIAVIAARVTAAAVIMILIRNRDYTVHITGLLRFSLKIQTIKSILRVGVPTGLDSGMFQLGRLVMQSLIATFGTASIAANAVTGQILNIVYIPGTAIQMAIITIVGQCMGAGETDRAASYTKRLILYGYLVTACLCAASFMLLGQILPVFNLSEEATEIAVHVLRYSLFFSALFHPLSFIPANALRAAGDVKFTMIVSIASMWIVRIGLSYFLESTLKLGLMSVWFAMYSDWFVRGAVFLWRFFSGKWRTKKLV